MDQINKIIKTSCAVLIFCIGLWLMFNQTRAYMKVLSKARETIKEDVVYQQQNTDNRQIVSYGELVALLLEPLDYDIRIDERNISKSEHNKAMIHSYGIMQGNYIKSYEYDNEGNICRIIYLPTE